MCFGKCCGKYFLCTLLLLPWIHSLNSTNSLYKHIRVSIPWDACWDAFILGAHTLYRQKFFCSYRIFVFSSLLIFHLCDKAMLFFPFKFFIVTLHFKSALGCPGSDLKLGNAGGWSWDFPPWNLSFPVPEKQNLPKWHWKRRILNRCLATVPDWFGTWGPRGKELQCWKYLEFRHLMSCLKDSERGMVWGQT